MFALLVDPLQPAVELTDPLTEQAPVGLELRLTRPAQADATLLPLQMGPAADQTRRQMFELCQLNLQLALEAARALGENIQDQTRSVEHATAQRGFQIAFLAGRELMVEQHQFRLLGLDLLA